MPDRWKSILVRIEGRVQGVWFRGWTVRMAERLSVRGWVRNLPDGAVEAVFAGRLEDVDALVARCRRGPPAAHVETLHHSPFDGAIGPGFHQR